MKNKMIYLVSIIFLAVSMAGCDEGEEQAIKELILAESRRRPLRQPSCPRGLLKQVRMPSMSGKRGPRSCWFDIVKVSKILFGMTPL